MKERIGRLFAPYPCSCVYLPLSIGGAKAGIVVPAPFGLGEGQVHDALQTERRRRLHVLHASVAGFGDRRREGGHVRDAVAVGGQRRERRACREHGIAEMR